MISTDQIAFAALNIPRPEGTVMIVIVAELDSPMFSVAVSEGIGADQAATMLVTAAKHISLEQPDQRISPEASASS